jgi:ATP-dependent RNA helicase RhlE
VLILSPTRELAAQIAESFAICGRHTAIKTVAIFGGVSQSGQVRALDAGVDVIVATPGRLWDLMGQGIVSLARVDTLVLDEADRMLDMGFLPDVRRILARIPKARQTLLFSATMPAPILELAKSILSSPVQVAVAPTATVAPKIQQGVYLVDQDGKRALLEHVLRRDEQISRALVFTRTKHGANKVVRQLLSADIQAEAIHGNKSQNARTRALAQFRAGTLRVLVATDIAARGLDVDSISHVINYDLPAEPESYVHRIGRTGRAGAEGIAFSFCSPEQRDELKAIERLIRTRLPVLTDAARCTAQTAPAQARCQPRVPGERPRGDSQESPRPEVDSKNGGAARPARRFLWQSRAHDSGRGRARGRNSAVSVP